MNYLVRELPKAKADKESILEWILERSPQGARAWLNAYDEALGELKSNAAVYAKAPENEDCPAVTVQQMFFKTKRGRVYRILYTVDGKEAFVLRVRGPGQAPVNPEQIDSANS